MINPHKIHRQWDRIANWETNCFFNIFLLSSWRGYWLESYNQLVGNTPWVVAIASWPFLSKLSHMGFIMFHHLWKIASIMLTVFQWCFFIFRKVVNQGFPSSPEISNRFVSQAHPCWINGRLIPSVPSPGFRLLGRERAEALLPGCQCAPNGCYPGGWGRRTHPNG